MYALKRGREWITAPEGLGPASWPIPPVIAADEDRTQAWLSSDLDQALERQQILRMAFGLATEVRAFR